MLRGLLPWIRTIKVILVGLAYALNQIFWFAPLALLACLKALMLHPRWRSVCQRGMERLPLYWMRSNSLIQHLTSSTTWNVTGLESLTQDSWYLLIANHQSWADILILQHVFKDKIPMPKFFLKRELLWTLPVASWACWLLGFPFMRRYSKATLAKHPTLKHKDIEATQHACQRFKQTPTTVANFIEGTRFSEKKRALQASPYRHLLRPKATGLGFCLAVLGHQFDKLINVTIIYPPGQASLWHFLAGTLTSITVQINVQPITADWLGDYQHDRAFRAQLQQKINALWQAKDEAMARCLEW